jgi:hypothetical protein
MIAAQGLQDFEDALLLCLLFSHIYLRSPKLRRFA